MIKLRDSLLLTSIIKRKSGVEFKNYCYSDGTAYIDADIDFSNLSYSTYYIAVKGEFIFDNLYWSNLFGYVAEGYYASYFGQLVFLSGSDIYLRRYSDLSSTGYNSLLSTTRLDSYSQYYPSTTIKNFGIFCALNSSSNPTGICKFIKFSEIKIIGDDTAIFWFKPAIVNGKAGMYDIVRNRFFTNANTEGQLFCE